MPDYVSLLQESIHKIESDVNEIVWPDAEKSMQKKMMDNCVELKKIASEMSAMLFEDNKRATAKILTDCNSIDDLMYQRGRIAQIQKMTVKK